MRTIILQRLCMFVAMCVTMIGARAEWSETFTASSFSDPLKEISKGDVTITFSDAEISNEWTVSNRNFEMRKSSTMTVSVPSGYRIREIYCYDDVKPGRYLTSETSGYAATWDEDKEEKKDKNGYKWRRLYSYDAPASSVTAKNSSSSETCEFRHIKVTYVETPKLSFAQSQYTVYAKSANFTPVINRNGHDGSVTYSSDNTNYAIYNTNGSVSPQYAGTTTLRATFAATANYAKGQCTAKIVVNRDPVTFSFKSTPPKVLFSEGGNVGRVIYNFYGNVNVATGSEQGFQSANTEFSLASSNTSVISEPNRTTGILTFGGTTGTATVTMKQTENNRYAATSLSHTFTVVRTDADGTVLIGDLNEWKMFSSLVNNEGMTTLNAKLEADIDLGSDITTVGTRDNKYSGTFDGQGHTIHINWNTYASALAPFKSVENVTIKNVRTTGQITTSGTWVAGLVYENYGTSTVTGCISEVNITATGDAGPYSSGLVESTRDGSNLTINDCVVSGTFSGSKHFFSGFVYYTEGTCTLNNCLYVGSNDAEFGYTFAYKATVNNCYYLNTCGDAQGTQVTAEQLKSGEVAYLLQNGRTDNVWGETIGTDTVPLLTTEANKHVNKVTFTQDEQPLATRYANTGKTVALPTILELSGENYDESKWYTLTIGDDFTATTQVSADRAVPVVFTVMDYYPISTAQDWFTFCGLVNGGRRTLSAKMMADIDLGTNLSMVGDDNNQRFAGTFDGDGHTLTIDWTGTGDYYRTMMAPFRYIENATIKNIHIKGKMSIGYIRMGGVVLSAEGVCFITGCSTDLEMSAEASGGGILENVGQGSTVTISDCLASFSFTGAKSSWGGIIGSFNGNKAVAHVSNCLYVGKNEAGSWCKTIARSDYAANLTIENCFYLSSLGSVQGTQVTEEQLRNGYVTKLLQADRTDQCHWAQELGGTPDFFNKSLIEKDNYVYYDTSEANWVCHNVYIADGTALPENACFWAGNISNSRTLAANGFYTLCLPYSIGIPQGVTAYRLIALNTDEQVAFFSPVTATTLSRGVPYLIKTGEEEMSLDVASETYLSTDITAVEAHDEASIMNLHGTFVGMSNAQATAANAYILQSDGKFHKVAGDRATAYIPPYRAFLTQGAAGAKAFTILLDDITGAHTIQTTDLDSAVRYYDLNGRYINDTLDGLPKGIYIGNGKKVMKK